jgi:hypothetical protein
MDKGKKKKSKEKGPNWNSYYSYWKENKKSDMRDKIKNHKNFDKRVKEKNKELKVEKT